MLAWYTIAWEGAMVLVSAYALLRGGWPERLVAVANVAASIASEIVPHGYGPHQALWGVFAVDIAFLAFLLWLALATDRVWLLFAAAFQLVPLVIHLAILLDGGLRGWAYRSGLGVFSYLVLASMAVGTFLYDRDRRAARTGASAAGRLSS